MGIYCRSLRPAILSFCLRRHFTVAFGACLVLPTPYPPLTKRVFPQPAGVVAMPVLGLSTFIGAPSSFKVDAKRYKATKEHTIRRPRKTRPSDINRSVTVYPQVAPGDIPPTFTVTKPAPSSK